MSGLEVAGLVLGALPLAIKAVQTYRKTLHSIKNVKRDLDYIERDLQTEQVRLQDTCETLLVGIVSPAKIDSMIGDPFGPEWKLYAERLDENHIFTHHRRLRLYTSYDRFEESITEMSKAAQELRLRLGIEEGSQVGRYLFWSEYALMAPQVSPSDQTSILETFKRNTSFTLKRKEYEAVISKMKASNAALQDLCKVHNELEPDRRRRSQGRVTKLLRGLSHSIYNALCSAITCACVSSHSIGLQLAHRNAVMLPNDVEEKVAQQFGFHITLKTTAAKENKSMQSAQPDNEVQVVAQWKNFQLRLVDDQPIPNPPTPTPSSTRISDLCDILGGEPKATAVNYYGYLLDTQRKFVLSLPTAIGTHKHITLRQVLDGSTLDLPPFGFKEQLQVALALSTSVLHLSGTPWLAQIMTLDDIIFLVGNENTTNQPSGSVYQPFVIQNVLTTSTLQAATPLTANPQTISPVQAFSQMRPINLAALSLGALLIQIVIGHVDKELGVACTMDIRSIVSKRERSSQLEEEVLEIAGINYARAVKWCFDSIYDLAGPQNARFWQNFYEAVILRLEDDLETLATN
ncbi:hypothetical protein E0Z10_g7668 [Xylaria hypoxylon]|uniref:DUF7580 domain-containing protein n=1 Tax=Xylaria hypoxylon TaxID=37992 RepID=A0A4Z0YRK3_9PEZI|nr:hypothetical protein E0Z10_g7668 [Xylaria hypoxylon]